MTSQAHAATHPGPYIASVDSQSSVPAPGRRGMEAKPMSKNMTSRSKWQVGGLLLAVLPALMMGGDAWAKVGVASVVNGEPLAKPPAETERVLKIGNDMVANEVVTTKANDRAQLVFLDGSTLTVGPNSEITIDKFVYDPDKRTGEQSFNVARGAFRYVGGAISKNSEVTVKSRGATMGIRGSIVTFAVGQTGQFTANFLFGQSMTITGQGQTQSTSQPGTQISVPANGAPTPPASIPPGAIQQMNTAFQGPSGQTGNSGITAAFGNSGLGQSNSGISPGQARGAIATTQQTQMGVHGNGQAAPGSGPNGGSQQGNNQQQGSGPQQGGGPQQAAGPQQGGGPQQAAGPQQGGGPLQGGGPQQGGGPLQGANPQQGAGPLQGASPLQGAGPMQGSGPESAGGPLQSAGPIGGAGPMEAAGPMQASGPLQNAGPLAAATPLQQTGPVGMPGNLAFNAPPPGGAIPNVAVQQTNFIPAAVAGNPQALQQLQNLLGPQTSPQTLNTLVNSVVSTPSSTTTSTTTTTTTTSTFVPSSPTINLTPSAPPVFNPTTSAKVSQGDGG